MWETNKIINPPRLGGKSEFTFFEMIYQIRLIWVIGWVGAGLYRLFVSLKYGW